MREERARVAARLGELQEKLCRANRSGAEENAVRAIREKLLETLAERERLDALLSNSATWITFCRSIGE